MTRDTKHLDLRELARNRIEEFDFRDSLVGTNAPGDLPLLILLLLYLEEGDSTQPSFGQLADSVGAPRESCRRWSDVLAERQRIIWTTSLDGEVAVELTNFGRAKVEAYLASLSTLYLGNSTPADSYSDLDKSPML